jgi:hypothetical protein
MVNKPEWSASFLSYLPKEFVLDPIGRQEGRGPRQKLPPTAIYCHLSPQNYYDRYNSRLSMALSNQHQQIQITP